VRDVRDAPDVIHHQRDPDYAEWVRSRPCLLARRSSGLDACSGPVQAAHVKSRGAGGGDRGNLIPLCHRHHHDQHQHGIHTFAKRYGLDLTFEATILTEKYRNLNDGIPF